MTPLDNPFQKSSVQETTALDSRDSQKKDSAETRCLSISFLDVDGMHIVEAWECKVIPLSEAAELVTGVSLLNDDSVIVDNEL